MKIALASDHAGYEKKQVIVDFLKEQGIEFKDFGAYSAESSDYPDYAHPMAKAVEDGNGMQTLKCIQKNMSLLDADFSEIGNGQSLIHRAIDSGNLAILTVSVSSPTPKLEIMDHKGRTPLIHALENRELHMVTVLLNRGASPTSKSSTGKDACTLAIELGPDYAQIFERMVPHVYAQHLQMVVNNVD